MHERLRGVLDGMMEGCQLIDSEWRYLYVNEAVARHGRTTASAMIGRKMTELYPGIEDTALFGILRECMATRVARRFENEFFYDDGTSAWFELSVQPQPVGLFILSMDVSERKRSARTAQHAADSVREAELLASSARNDLNSVIRASPAPIAALDHEGNVIIWNDAAERLFGWSASEVLHRPPPIVPSDRRAEFERLRENAARGINVRHFVTVRVARSGRRIPVSISTSVVKDGAGSAVGMVAVLMDLTEQTALREALLEAEQRFAAAFEASPTPMLLLRAVDQRVVEVNRAYLELGSVPRVDVIGQPAARLPVLPPASADVWAQLRATGAALDVEFEYRSPAEANGVATATLIRVPIQGEDFVQIAIQDITERKRAEQALRESDERFRQIADTIQEVFWLTDTAKSKIVYVSPAYESIWGRPCASLYDEPHTWLDAIHPEDRTRVEEAALTKQRSGTYDEEYRIIRPDGSVRWIRDRGFPVKAAPGEESTLVAGSAQDITERRQLEAQLRQTQKLESIGLLAGGVAHDFNNLLTVIASSCYSLKELTVCGSECEEIVDEIRQATDRATALTRQLLAFSRREVVVPRIIELTAVVTDTEKMLRRVLGEDILLTLVLGRRTSRVKVDPGSWVQVLMNLAVNARDAMPRGGKLIIETGHTVIESDCVQAHSRLTPGPYVTLSVTDTGTGMSPEVQARIFEPFFTTKNAGHGTGLGLSVVHGIVSQSGGHIQVWSSEGSGTTFRIYLPVAEAADAAEDAKVAARAERGGAETILLVEDEEPIRRISARALEKLGYTVLACSDGIEALTAARSHRGDIHILVTDVVMPRMDGYSLAQALKVDRPGLQVLYTSGYTDDSVVRYGVQRHGELELLPKPYDPSELRRRIRELLDSRGASADRSQAQESPPPQRKSARP